MFTVRYFISATNDEQSIVVEAINKILKQHQAEFRNANNNEEEEEGKVEDADIEDINVQQQSDENTSSFGYKDPATGYSNEEDRKKKLPFAVGPNDLRYFQKGKYSLNIFF